MGKDDRVMEKCDEQKERGLVKKVVVFFQASLPFTNLANRVSPSVPRLWQRKIYVRESAFGSSKTLSYYFYYEEGKSLQEKLNNFHEYHYIFSIGENVVSRVFSHM